MFITIKLMRETILSMSHLGLKKTGEDIIPICKLCGSKYTFHYGVRSVMKICHLVNAQK